MVAARSNRRRKMAKKHSPVFSIKQVEQDGKVVGYAVFGFLTEEQLKALEGLITGEPGEYSVSRPQYDTTKRWRGQYQAMSKAFTRAASETRAKEAQ
jgi:hypothetical protein